MEKVSLEKHNALYTLSLLKFINNHYESIQQICGSDVRKYIQTTSKNPTRKEVYSIWDTEESLTREEEVNREIEFLEEAEDSKKNTS